MAYIDQTTVKGTTYDLKDSSAVHSVNGVTPDADGNVAVTRASIGAADDTVVVKHTSQSLTTDQKTQARTNIAAASTTDITTLQNELGIVCTGNKTTVAAEKGQYIILKNSTISGCSDGLYTAAQAIPANTVIDSTYLTAVSGGGLNALNSNSVHYKSIPISGTCDGTGNVNIGQITENICGYFYKADSGTFDGFYILFRSPSLNNYYLHGANFADGSAAHQGSSYAGTLYYSYYN